MACPTVSPASVDSFLLILQLWASYVDRSSSSLWVSSALCFLRYARPSTPTALFAQPPSHWGELPVSPSSQPGTAVLLPIWWVVQTACLLQWIPTLPSPASGCYSVLQFCVVEQALYLTLGSQHCFEIQGVHYRSPGLGDTPRPQSEP